MNPTIIIWKIPDKNGVTHTFILYTDFFPSRADFILFGACEHEENNIPKYLDDTLPKLWDSINSKMI